MSGYIHGSLALDRREEQSARAAHRPKTAAKKAQRAVAVPVSEKLLWICGILFCCAVAGLYQFREASMYEMNSRVVQMEREIKSLEEQNTMLRNEIAKLESPERLIEAGVQLGLVPQGELPAASNGTVALSAAE
ncbi:hypothetical protein [Paenibacillus sp.]|uniref:hypothetical protein n=1 Tax=Paenibacillus sp. TaxID=58172 RepID=UPI002D6C22B0|nr:hypothetical protein [Paenibacillus sp.]HZG88266.1 hypothetical protein [Paenibacillus sp.]